MISHPCVCCSYNTRCKLSNYTKIVTLFGEVKVQKVCKETTKILSYEKIDVLRTRKMLGGKVIILALFAQIKKVCTIFSLNV